MNRYHVMWTYVANFSTHSQGHPYFSAVDGDSVKDAIDKAWGFYLDPKTDSVGEFRSKAHFIVVKEGERNRPWVGKYADATNI